MSENLNWTEDFSNGAHRVHALRYYFARGLVEAGDVVLDASCGWGAGSNILKRSQARNVYGLDYRSDCIAHNQATYPGITFVKEDLNKAEALPACDLAVSIETIEHLTDPKRFAEMMKKASRRSIFISTPIVPTKHVNTDHKHDFTPADVQAMFIDEEWKCIHWMNQGNLYGCFMFKKL